jgi:hypothetical protein
METKKTCNVSESHRVAVRCKYLGPTNHLGSRISVQRYEGATWGKDPNRLIISWDYALNIGENYAEAVRQYVEKANWGGQWVTSNITDGAVAVCIDAIKEV